MMQPISFETSEQSAREIRSGIRRLHAKLPATPILVIRPGVQANGKENALRLTEDGATQVSFTLEHAHTAAEQQLVMNEIEAARTQTAL